MPETSKPHILIVEDEVSLRTLLAQNLRFEGYAVSLANHGMEALEWMAKQTPDLILLDLMLPRMSGIELCKHLRRQGKDMPIIMLTARGEVADKVRGLKTGADDYVTKPFDLMELLARIESQLRRRKKPFHFQEAYQTEDFHFHFSRRMIRRSGQTHELTQQESLLLRYLMHHAGTALSREQIFTDVWGHDELYSYRTIDTHITKLRQKIESEPRKPRYILTVHRVGYRFEDHPIHSKKLDQS
ncbi:MAG: response regulator transcription factor [Bacteroidota bacterium]